MFVDVYNINCKMRNIDWILVHIRGWPLLVVVTSSLAMAVRLGTRVASDLASPSSVSRPLLSSTAGAQAASV